MLVVAVQPYPVREVVKENGSKNVEMCPYSMVDSDIVEEFGYPLMEVVPVTTFQDTLASLFLLSPGLPQCFCVFQVADEDVICVDKVVFYQSFVHTGSPQYHVLHDEVTLPGQKMYFVNMQKLNQMPFVFGDVEAILDFMTDDSKFGSLLEIGPVKQTAPVDFIKDIKTRLLKIEKGDEQQVVELCRKQGILNPEGHARVLVAWRLYRYVIAPLLLWDLCTDTGGVHRDGYHSLNLELAAVESCTRTWKACDMWSGQMGAWLASDGSAEQLSEIYVGLKKVIIDNFAVLGAWLSGTKIGVNEPCPCGSGLKYKKCHGVWH